MKRIADYSQQSYINALANLPNQNELAQMYDPDIIFSEFIGAVFILIQTDTCEVIKNVDGFDIKNRIAQIDIVNDQGKKYSFFNQNKNFALLVRPSFERVNLKLFEYAIQNDTISKLEGYEELAAIIRKLKGGQ